LALVEKDLEKGINTVKTASESNLDIKLYFKLIIQKFRMAIILHYAPKLEEQMAGDLSASDLEFLKKIIKEDKDRVLRSGALALLLDAYQNMDNAFIPELPLELALIKILGQDK
jgi:copper homeostasis protein CutC